MEKTTMSVQELSAQMQWISAETDLQDQMERWCSGCR